MDSTKICLTLTGATLAEDAATLERFRRHVDMAELRVDCLNEGEQLFARRFPAMAGVPCILTIRRDIDGGRYIGGEAARTVLFARALAFNDEDPSKNFAFVDFEEDYRVPSLEDATLAFETRIIRSVHEMKSADGVTAGSLLEHLGRLRRTGLEIPKIAFTPRSLEDVAEVFKAAAQCEPLSQILIAMGPQGAATRILGARLGNFLTYTYAAPEQVRGDNQGDRGGNLPDAPTRAVGQIDVETLCGMYRAKEIGVGTKVYGITGWPLEHTASPAIHNSRYAALGIDAVYIPLPAERFEQALTAARAIGAEGLSVTVPHKGAALAAADEIDESAAAVGAANTLVRRGAAWRAYNTDAEGLLRALLELLGARDLRGRRCAIIGAGGAARAAAYAVKSAGGSACVFNRTTTRAREIAERHGFDYAPLSPASLKTLQKYSDVIIQATSCGMGVEAGTPSCEANDPLFFYDFTGRETLFDVVYAPAVTPVMARAQAAGSRVCNGEAMLLYQAERQLELFTGVKY